MTRNADIWITEFHNDILSVGFRVERTLFSQQSKFQKVDVVETKGHGKMLFVDGYAMISEREEFVYHDMISHVAMFTHPNPERVLIIGGGDGGTAREVLRHPGVTRAVQVEIDEVVVEACKQHIPQTAHVYDNPRLELRIADGLEFMANTEETFDVVIVDSTDPIGPAAPLFGEGFYQDVHRVLADDGIVVAQGESSFYMAEEQRSILKSIGASFPKVHCYNYHTLVYPGGLWSFVFASKGLCPIDDYRAERVKDSGLKFKYYNTAIHRAAFSLPEFQKEGSAGY